MTYFVVLEIVDYFLAFHQIALIQYVARLVPHHARHIFYQYLKKNSHYFCNISKIISKLVKGISLNCFCEQASKTNIKSKFGRYVFNIYL